MPPSFAPPAVPDSPVSRWDPRWKLAGLALGVVAFLLLQTVAASLVALGGAVLLLCLSRLPLRWTARRLLGAALLLALFAGWMPLADTRLPAWVIGPLHLSLPGLEQATVIVAKALAVIAALLVMWTTAPLDATLKAAHALRVPGLVVQLLLLTYRYLFLLADEFARMRLAVRVRGFKGGMNRHTYRTIGHVSGTLLVRSQERAERVSQAMRCRGFDGRFRSLVEFHTTRSDVAGFLAVVLIAAALLAWDLSRHT